jgi:hypothetical protein
MNRPGQQAFTRPVAEALGANQALGQLLERLRESRARFECARHALPPALQAWVQPGVLDDEGWTLSVPNAAVAAKLRHSLPAIEALLGDGGWRSVPLRVRIRAHGN